MSTGLFLSLHREFCYDVCAEFSYKVCIDCVYSSVSVNVTEREFLFGRNNKFCGGKAGKINVFYVNRKVTVTVKITKRTSEKTFFISVPSCT